MKARLRTQRGLALVLASLILIALIGAMWAVRISIVGFAAQRDRVSDSALAQAREALIAYASDHAISAWVGPGYLPCPDLDDDGWAEATCGSQSGDSGQEERLGRLPWKTLGLPDLRDGYGERLWYAVSSKYKGLLNCAVSRACLDMSPGAALGTISVRDRSGTLIHDGTSMNLLQADRAGAVAVVIAPGPALAGQVRDCGSGACDAAGRCLADPPRSIPKCHPANYLDNAPAERGESNADFIDRNDAAGRPRNANGFIQGPVLADDGAPVVNDRLAVIAYRDVMPRIMKRVALEVAHCLRFYATRPENEGRYPWPAAACRQDNADPWADAVNVPFGRIPDTPFTRTRDASGGRMLDRWWRYAPRSPETLAELPVRDSACRVAFEPADAANERREVPGTPPEEGRTAGLAENSWWTFWKPYVFYALAEGKPPEVIVAAAPLDLTRSCNGETNANDVVFTLP